MSDATLPMTKPAQPVAPDPGPARVTAWPSERPLFLALLFASLAVWALLIVSLVGIAYAGLILLFLFASHVVFVTFIRGSAVRLGPHQLPELYARIEELSRRAGLREVPEAYLLEAGGNLNAFATRFLGRPMMVLYSDLLDACEDNPRARDMIIGHELGHIRANHLRWLWILAPGMAIPFLGSAYSRARELTCDRWGAALCGDREAATFGMTVLAAGKRHAPEVNLQAFVAQGRDLDTGWMTLGRWLSGYPPLCERVAALDPGLVTAELRTGKGTVRALAMLGVGALAPFVIVSLAMTAVLLPALKAASSQFEQALATDPDLWDEAPDAPVFETVEEFEEARTRAETDLEDLMRVLQRHAAETGELPTEIEELEPTWLRNNDRPFPTDPFDGFPYGYEASSGSEVALWSSGADGESLTNDDIRLERVLDLAPSTGP